MTKRWYHSRMMWINIVALVATIVELATGQVMVAAIQDSIVAIINIFLRAHTNQGLSK
mgnify:CR=1 FL=1